MTKSLALSIAFAISALVTPASAGVIFFEDFSSGFISGQSAGTAKPEHFDGTSRVLNDVGATGFPAPNVRLGGDEGIFGNPLDRELILHSVALSGGNAAVTLSYDLRTGNFNSGSNYTLDYQFYNAADGIGDWITAGSGYNAGVGVVDGWANTPITHQVSGTGEYVAFKWTYTGDDPNGGFRFDNITVTAVPEPTSLAFAGIACGAAAFARRRHKKNSQKSAEATPGTATA